MFTQKGNYIIRCLFFITTLFWMASCENNLKTVSIITSEDKTPLEVEENASITYNDSAKIKFHLSSPRIENYGGQNPYVLYPKGVSIDGYDDSGHLNSHLDAGYLIVHKNTNLYEADNNVRVVNRKGEKLTTEQLFWDANKHKIYSNKFVTLQKAKQIIYGDGLVSNEDFTKDTIRNIHGTIEIDNPDDNNKDNK